MSLKAMTLVWDRARAKGSSFLVLLGIADCAKDDGRHAWPSPGGLAVKSRLTGRAAELILAQLVVDGEVAAEWSEADERLYLHIRCVADWPAYQTEGPPLRCEKISRSVKRTYAQKLCRLTAAFANGTARYANATAPYANVDAQSGGASITDPSDPSDPSGSVSELKAGAPPRRTPPADTPDDNVGVITKLAHEAIDQLGETHLDLTEAVKALCSEHQIRPYDSGVVRKAIESAIWQRRHRQRSG